jgi:hypothetical protein
MKADLVLLGIDFSDILKALCWSILVKDGSVERYLNDQAAWKTTLGNHLAYRHLFLEEEINHHHQ